MEEYESNRGTVGMAVKETEREEVLKKKRKLGSEDSEQSSSNYDNAKNYPSCDSSEKLMSPIAVENSSPIFDGDFINSMSGADHVPASHCSSDGSSDLPVDDCLKSVDPKAKGFETDKISASITNGFSETSSLSDICTESDEMDSSVKKLAARDHQRKTTAEKMPSAAEIDDFFCAAEKYNQKQFLEKYNYDVVKDLPMEGSYQWIRLKP